VTQERDKKKIRQVADTSRKDYNSDKKDWITASGKSKCALKEGTHVANWVTLGSIHAHTEINGPKIRGI
jgi:hypothetical protein